MIKNIGIYGSGQIGKSLAILFSGLGLNVIIFCRDRERIIKETAIGMRVARKMNAHFNFNGNEIIFTNNINDLKKLDLLIECVKEDFAVKNESLCMLSKILDSDTIVGSTTSTYSISKLSTNLKQATNFIGLHFFNPPTLINFLEIIKSEKTSDATLNKICEFFDSINFKYAVLKKENPGFIVNRALFLMLNEAIFELEESVATARDIDLAFINGLRHPMGPLELCDFIGLDIVLDILKILQKEYGNEKYKPCNLLIKKVNSGYFGKKTKEGFYTYK
jgi:3-hydroxybutyryl-CoA dehydrogenase